MIYALSIDWLSCFAMYMGTDVWQPREDAAHPFMYKTESFGTRVFKRFVRVRVPNAEGGVDEFAEIQAEPYSSILPNYAVIVRFVNRTLYMPNFWDIANELFVTNQFQFNSITRVDICADFNDFATISPVKLIEGFAAKKFRHIGRGVGALYFNHGIGVEHDEHDHPVKDYGVRYTGVSFGTHASDAHVYLYNKSEELRTQGNKPWIRDIWKSAGLDELHVWRLEVSIKSSGLKFRDKETGNTITINDEMIGTRSELDKIYHTFVRRLFSFVPNRKGITNITHEFRKNGLVLFDDRPAYDRGSIRNVSSGDRMERILIKNLHFLSDKYRGVGIYQAEETSKHLANCLAYATDLHDWYMQKQAEWEKPIHK